MVLIIGGAYQGKLDYAKAAFSIEDNDVFACNGAEIDFSRLTAKLEAGAAGQDELPAHEEEIDSGTSAEQS